MRTCTCVLETGSWQSSWTDLSCSSSAEWVCGGPTCAAKLSWRAPATFDDSRLTRKANPLCYLKLGLRKQKWKRRGLPTRREALTPRRVRALLLSGWARASAAKSCCKPSVHGSGKGCEHGKKSASASRSRTRAEALTEPQQLCCRVSFAFLLCGD